MLNKATAKKADFDNLIGQGFRKVSSDRSVEFLARIFLQFCQGEVKILNRATATTEMFQNVLAEGFIPGTPSSTRGGTEAERGREMFSKNYDAYADGTLDAETTRLINMFLTDQYGVKTEFKTEYDSELGRRVRKPVEVQAAIPQVVTDAVNSRREIGKSLPGITPPDATPPPAVGTAAVDQAGTPAPAPAVSEEAVTTSVSAPAETAPSEATKELQSICSNYRHVCGVWFTKGALVQFFRQVVACR